MTKENQNKIFTVPNILSVVRLVLIPVIIWLYCIKEEYVWTAAVLVLSALTDILDGYIARHFNMISNLGKALDPVADKFTQGAVLLCLITRFPLISVPLVILVVKEMFNGLLHFWAMKKTGVVYGADWHGKVTTCMLYAMMLLHVIWTEVPAYVSDISIAMCIVMMVISMILYTYQILRKVKTVNLYNQTDRDLIN